MARCFIGFLIQEGSKEKIRQVIGELKSLPMECKFVEEENLHLCFSFLGEVEDEKIKDISSGVNSVASNYSSFDVKIHGMRMIPNENYIRVLALDVDGGSTLIRMIKSIQEEVGGDAKPPHLTLCRIRSIKDKQTFVERIKELQGREITNFTVDSIQLIRSELSKSGPIYTSIHESKLKVE
jgi:2'-5' RNA ligase